MTLLLLLGNHDDADTGYPHVYAEVAFTTAPGATPVWTDVTDYVRLVDGIVITRGRDHLLARPNPGTMSLVLDNLDRRFEPEYAAGVYYPNVLPRRRVRVSVTWGNVFHVHTGFIERWQPIYPGVSDAVTRVDSLDGLAVLATVRLTESYSQESSGTRVTNVLDDAAWPAADRDLATGLSTVQASTLSQVAALEHLNAVVETENGRHFVDGEGVYNYHDRMTALEEPYLTSQATFGDAGGSELPYEAITLSYDTDELYNDIQITRTGGTVQQAENTTSQTAYLVRTLTRTGQLQTTNAEALDSANWLLQQFGNPRLRVSSITVRGSASYPLNWPQVFGRELGDRITVKLTPPGGGARVEQELTIEHITLTSGALGTWTARWKLSGVDAEPRWILGDAALSLLGESTYPGY